MNMLESTIGELDGFTIEYRLESNLVVFSHGFGVRRDARGMFTDIVANLPAGIGYLLIDYNKSENDALRLSSMSDQVARLQTMIAWAKQQPGVRQLALVAHSKGCTVSAMAGAEQLASVIMLAPSLHAGSGIRARFTTRPGATKQGATWAIPRTDGTVSLIDEAVLEELDNSDGEKAVLAYGQKQPLHIIAAGSDNVLIDQDYSRVAQCPGATFVTIDAADHDFTGVTRQPMVEAVVGYLRTDLKV